MISDMLTLLRAYEAVKLRECSSILRSQEYRWAISIDDFVAQLKQLIIGFRNNPYRGGYEEDMIRDQIADKMRDTS